MNKKDYDTDCQKAKLDGKKPPVLFTIEFIFYYAEQLEYVKSSLGRYAVHNQSRKEIDVYRESIFTFGFLWPKAPGRAEIVLPTDLFRVLIDVQKNGWKEIAEGPVT